MLVAHILVCTTVPLQLAGLVFVQAPPLEAEGFDATGSAVSIKWLEIQGEPGESTVISVTYRMPENRYQNRQSDLPGFGLEQMDIISGEYFGPDGELMNGKYVYSEEVTLSAPSTSGSSAKRNVVDVEKRAVARAACLITRSPVGPCLSTE